MLSKRTSSAFLAIALACLLTPAAGAQSRQAELRPADEGVLEPREDGSYLVPLGDGEMVPLRFEAADAPIELISLRINERNALVAELRSTAKQTITAWRVELLDVDLSGRRIGSSALLNDWGVGSIPPAPGFRRMGGPTEDQPIRPRQVRTAELGLLGSSEPSELVLTVPLVLFEDFSHEGSDRYAYDVLEDRSMAADRLTRWTGRLTEILDSARTENELAHEVRELIAEIEEEAGEDLSVPAHLWAHDVRESLLVDLKNLLQPERLGRSLRERLQERIRVRQWRLDHLRPMVPPELPEAPRTPRTKLGMKVDEGPGGDPVGDNVDDCDCGGSLGYSKSTLDSRLCDGTAQGWQVDENWMFTCRNESGSSIGGGNRSLLGLGGCVVGNPCFADKYCPPEFTGPSIDDSGGLRVFSRGVADQRLYVGLCFTTTRCEKTGQTRLLSFTCQCEPMPRPRCFADGCPILIETGAGGFRLTDAHDGVSFDLVGHGVPSQVAWTVAGGDDAWLVLDRNGNGRIDDATELFGDRTDQPHSDEPHGFRALAVFDEAAHGGNEDGAISADDGVFDDLRLWLDHDHDGVTDLGELIPLASADIEAIELDFFRSERRDRHGNRFRYSTRVRLASGGHRLATDVFLQFE